MTLLFKPRVLALVCCAGVLAATGVLYVKSKTPDAVTETVVVPPIATASTPTAPVAAPAATAPKGTFSSAQIDQWVAPIALYPDPLLSQVLMASTYPANVVLAAQWSKDNPNLKGDPALQAVMHQPWDPSVKSLVAFPQLLALMDNNPPWVQNLGDAFLAQPQEVMDSIQKLRHLAQQAGTLKSTPEQKVTTSSPILVNQTTNLPTTQPPASGGTSTATAPATQTISIQSANPGLVYVPTYNPTTAYGTWPNTAYPPVYLPPEENLFGDNLVRGLGFGVGIAATYALFSNLDWDDDDYDGHHHYGGGGGNNINIDVDRYNRVSGGRLPVNSNDRNTWQHNPAYRSGVPYQDRNVSQRYNQNTTAATQSATRNSQRQQAQQQLQQRTGATAGASRGASPNTGARNVAAVKGARDVQRQAASEQIKKAARRDSYRGYDTSPQPRKETVKAAASRSSASQQQRDVTRSKANINSRQQQSTTPRANALSGNDSRSPSWKNQSQRGAQSRNRETVDNKQHQAPRNQQREVRRNR